MPGAIKIEGLGDISRRLEQLIGKVSSDKEIAEALKPSTRIIADAWRRDVPVSVKGVKSGKNAHTPGGIRRAIVDELVGRGKRNGRVTVFAAINRKKAPQAAWIKAGSKHQKAKPSVFDRPWRQVREQVQSSAREALARMVAKFARF